MFTVIVEVSLCAPGWSGGLVPELRLGVLRLSWCRGSLIARVREWRDALTEKVRGIGGNP